MGAQLAFWSLSANGASQKTPLDAKVHSTLSVRDVVTATDCKSGLLAVGTTTSLSVYTLTLQNDVPTWSKKWEADVPMLSQILFSPSLTHIASISSEHKTSVLLHLTAVPRETQTIRHPRPLSALTWRTPKPHSRPDLTLYTLTSDSTLRIFHPVLDAPQRLQLHATLDATSFLSSPMDFQTSGSHIFPLDRQVLGQALTRILDTPTVANTLNKEINDVADIPDWKRRLEEIKNEDWDLFLRILKDGSLVIRGVTNIDQRPPTLLKQFSLTHTPPLSISSQDMPTQLVISIADEKRTQLAEGFLTMTTCPPLTAHDLEPFAFSNAPGGLKHIATTGREGYGVDRNEEAIEGFLRTPDGSGIAVVRTSGGEAWTLEGQRDRTRLRRVGRWRGKGLITTMDSGRYIAIHDHPQQLTFKHFTTTHNKEYSLAVPELTSLFSLPSTQPHTLIIGITTQSSIVQIHVPPALDATNGPILYSNTTLPLPNPPRMVLPVDPMAWSTYSLPIQDVLVSISNEGELAFWIPEAESAGTPECDRGKWRCTGTVHTDRKNIRMARCSSAKKTVLVVPGSEGEEITIWDSIESEFSSGLEYRHVSSLAGPIKDLDWTSTRDGLSILAIGYEHHVVLLCQQRMTYFEQEPAWGIFGKIDISYLTPYPISDSIWLAGGSLLIAAGHQMFHFGQTSSQNEATKQKSLFELVTLQNAPLVDYHPQMLLQCLLWDKLELVKRIIVYLGKCLEDAAQNDAQEIRFPSIPVTQFLKICNDGSPYKRNRPTYSTLFNVNQDTPEKDIEQEFSRSLVNRVVALIETSSLLGLTPNERSHLIVLIQTTLEVDEQRRSLDSNGLRYLFSMRSFYILNQRAISGTTNVSSGGRQRLRYRDMMWAFYSQSQEILLEASTAACGGKMIWDDAKALGIFLWMDSTESMKNQMEVIARNEYMTGDVRDPTRCALYYFALGKVRLVHGLWRQATWHKEQAVMLRFLSNDFQEPRWKTAALKNAYALLGKQRFAYAAAFFLLGGSLKDAVNICIKQLDDFQLAIALARVVEQGDEGPIFQGLLTTIVIPLAFKEGNRWLGSWAFWKLKRRDLAVRILLTPLNELAKSLDIIVTDVGDPHYDDPSLALLFSQLKLKSLQTAKGSSEISGRTEFNFVLQMARVFCRMGCHKLALDITTSWSFETVTARQIHRDPDSTEVNVPSAPGQPQEPPTPSFKRRPYGLHLKRRSSMVIDMDIPSLPPTEPVTPTEASSLLTRSIPEEPLPVPERKDGALDVSERQKGLGNLLKSAKQDISVPEFDMNAFF